MGSLGCLRPYATARRYPPEGTFVRMKSLHHGKMEPHALDYTFFDASFHLKIFEPSYVIIGVGVWVSWCAPHRTQICIRV
jgi:hypothetical protein